MFSFIFRRRQQERLRQVEAVLFDLDGTLLQVAMDRYIPEYIRGLGRHVGDLVEEDIFVRAAHRAVGRLFTHPDGVRTNEQHFLDSIAEGAGVDPPVFRQRLQRYYVDGMHDLGTMVEAIPEGRRIVEACFRSGLKVALATNPVFPRPLVEARLAAGGLGDLPFHLLTSYENSRFCKPDLRYYQAVAEDLGIAPKKCLMVGNDTDFDLGAARAGMMTYLVDTYLVDRLGGRWRADFQGDHGALERFVERLGPAAGN